MRENHLFVEVKRYCRTTWSQHSFRQFLYLVVLMDLFTRAIRSWELGRSLNKDLTLTALQCALQTIQPEIHHSDQGVQYAATRYFARDTVLHKLEIVSTLYPAKVVMVRYKASTRNACVQSGQCVYLRRVEMLHPMSELIAECLCTPLTIRLIRFLVESTPRKFERKSAKAKKQWRTIPLEQLT